MVSDVEGKRQMSTFMIAEAFAIEPYFRQIINRIETHKNALSSPAPGQRESRLIPGRPQIIAPFVKLVVPTGGDGDDFPAIEATFKTAGFVVVKSDIPEARQVGHLALGIDLRIKHGVIVLVR